MPNQINTETQLYFNFTLPSLNENSAKEEYKNLGRRKKLSVQTIMWLDKRKKRISEIIQKLKQREYSSLAESRIEQLNLSLASINQKLFLEFKWHDKFMEEVYSHLPYFDYE